MQMMHVMRKDAAMFNVTETLDPALIEKPLSVLWENISPLYLADDRITSYNVCYTKLLRY